MPRKAVSEQEIVAFLNYAVAHHKGLSGDCRNVRVTGLVRREASRGRSNWDFCASCADPDKCAPTLRKIARELGAVYDLK